MAQGGHGAWMKINTIIVCEMGMVSFLTGHLGRKSGKVVRCEQKVKVKYFFTTDQN